MQESPFLNPDWLGETSSLSIRYSNISLTINFSKRFLQIGSRAFYELELRSLFPFRWKRTTFQKLFENELHWLYRFYSLVIRQKGESQNGCFKKIKHVKFSENEHFLPPCACQEVMLFFCKIWRALFSWDTCFEIRPFALLPTLCHHHVH